MTASLPPLPAADRWIGQWIEPAEPPGRPPVQRPAYHLAGEVIIGGPVASAWLHATAHGIYEAFVNGVRVGDEELRPGFTAYRSRLQAQSYDVTNLVTEGVNALGALVSDGWWRGQQGFLRVADSYGPATGFLAELHVTLRGGGTIVAGTGESWRSAPSHILAADLMAGEVHDLRRRLPGWAQPGTDRSGWDPVQVAWHGYAQLGPVTGPPCRRIQELPAVSVTELAPGRHVADFGQNSNGWVRLHSLGPAGTRLTLTYGECLDAAGDVTQDSIKDSPLAPERAGVPFQTDVVISAGDGTVFEPRHSTKGFRYVRIEGHPGPLSAADVTSIVVHTDLRRIGAFECSDERVNRLHQAAEWSFRGNACEVPTDCPTRERSGWTGDWQVYTETAAYLYDVTDFSAKWLRDLAADQRGDGNVTHIVPDPAPDLPFAAAIRGSAGWGDAAVHVPWEIYQATGRTEILAGQYDSMTRWVDFAAAQAASGRHPARIAERPEPLPHEAFLWDTGWHFGEWLEPGADPRSAFRQLLDADHGPVATAYLHRSAAELSNIAVILGDSTAASRYAKLADSTLRAWRHEFLNAAGNVRPATQANLVRGLAFGLIPGPQRTQAAAQLVALIRAAGTHLGTGFLATPFLLPVLADHGYLQVAYELLLQDTPPSWLAMTGQGATTIWESWQAVRDDPARAGSLNHYSKGAVISFLHRYTAGLQIAEPGYLRFRVAPRPGGGITSARTHHDSPHGRIELAWALTGGRGHLDLTVPDGTKADINLPDQTTAALGPGAHHLTWEPIMRDSGPSDAEPGTWPARRPTL
jgi:alpha-L-rhamnosidase